MHTTNTAINVIAKYVKRIEIHYIQVRFKFTFIVQLEDETNQKAQYDKTIQSQ